jgi:SPP1 family phage portal protein
MRGDIRPLRARPISIYMQEGVSVTVHLVEHCERVYRRELRRYAYLEKYYMAENEISNRPAEDDSKPNNKIVHPFARYITKIATAYFMGLGMRIQCDDDGYRDALAELVNANQTDVKHFEEAKDMSKFGRSYELLYINEEGALKTRFLPAAEVRPIYGQGTDGFLVAAIWRFTRDEFDGKRLVRIDYANVYTKTEVFRYTRYHTVGAWRLVDQYPHMFSDVPIIVRWNNTEQKGDYEDVITLIDAYDRAQSDTANDLDYFTDAYLAIVGAEDIVTDGEDGSESTEAASTPSERTVRTLKRERVFIFPDGGDMKFVTKTINDTATENYKSRTYKNLFFLALVPNLTDENFSGNLSGVAIKYKLFGLEELAAEKEKYFTSSELKKLRFMTEYINTMRGTSYDWRTLQLSFDRSSVSNLLELAQIINYLRGLLSDETLISMWPEIEDAIKELEKRLAEERKKENDDLPPDMETRIANDT